MVLDEAQLLARQQQQAIAQQLRVRLGIDRRIDDAGHALKRTSGGVLAFGDRRQLQDLLRDILADDGDVAPHRPGGGRAVPAGG